MGRENSLPTPFMMHWRFQSRCCDGTPLPRQVLFQELRGRVPGRETSRLLQVPIANEDWRTPTCVDAPQTVRGRCRSDPDWRRCRIHRLLSASIDGNGNWVVRPSAKNLGRPASLGQSDARQERQAAYSVRVVMIPRPLTQSHSDHPTMVLETFGNGLPPGWQPLRVNKGRLKKRRGDPRPRSVSWFRRSGHHGCANSATESGSWLGRGHRSRQVGMGWFACCWCFLLGLPRQSARVVLPSHDSNSAIPWGFPPFATMSVWLATRGLSASVVLVMVTSP